jgi:hypothetical protein
VDPRLQKLRQEIASAADEFSPEQLSIGPPGKWCAGEVLEHLYLTYTGTMKGFERVRAGGKPLVANPVTWAQRWRILVVVGLGYLPFGREAPAVARPRGLPAEKVRSEIAAKIGEMDEVIAHCEEKFGRRSRLLDHPILGPLTASQWRRFHLVHGRHHIKQLRALRGMVVRAGGTGK